MSEDERNRNAECVHDLVVLKKIPVYQEARKIIIFDASAIIWNCCFLNLSESFYDNVALFHS